MTVSLIHSFHLPVPVRSVVAGLMQDSVNIVCVANVTFYTIFTYKKMALDGISYYLNPFHQQACDFNIVFSTFYKA